MYVCVCVSVRGWFLQSLAADGPFAAKHMFSEGRVRAGGLTITNAWYLYYLVFFKRKRPKHLTTVLSFLSQNCPEVMDFSRCFLLLPARRKSAL